MGGVVGVMVLVKSLFVLWIPMGLATVVWCWGMGGSGDQQKAEGGSRWRGVWLAGCVYLMVAVAVPMPWWVRNCTVLEAFMPLGTQGGIGLAGGYSDASVAARGQWVKSWKDSGALYVPNEDGVYELGIEQERRWAIAGQRRGLTWIKENPGKVPYLAMRKLMTLWFTPKYYNLILLGISSFGLVWSRGRPMVWLLWGMLGYYSLMVMATYASGGGRFIIPFQLVVFMLVGIGGWRIGEWLDARKKAKVVAAAE